MEDFEIPVTIALAVFILAIFVTCCFYNCCSKRSIFALTRRRNDLSSGKQTFKQWVKSAVQFHPLDKGSCHRHNNSNGCQVPSMTNNTYSKKTFTQRAYQSYPPCAKGMSSNPSTASGKWSLKLTTINEEESNYEDDEDDLVTVVSEESNEERQKCLPLYMNV